MSICGLRKSSGMKGKNVDFSEDTGLPGILYISCLRMGWTGKDVCNIRRGFGGQVFSSLLLPFSSLCLCCRPSCWNYNREQRLWNTAAIARILWANLKHVEPHCTTVFSSKLQLTLGIKTFVPEGERGLSTEVENSGSKQEVNKRSHIPQ